MRFACLIVAALISVSPMLAQTALPQAAPSLTVHQVFVQDDEDHPAMNTPEAIAAFEQRHRDRSQQVRDLLAKGQITSADQLYDAAWVLQHGETADDYLLAHILAVDALAKGNTSAKWLTAATLDRYLQLAQHPQLFGTQYPLDPAKPHPISADGRGRFAGRTQAPYDEQVLPEAIRADFCVPPTSQQKQNLATLNSGNYPATPWSCPAASADMPGVCPPERTPLPPRSS